MDDLERLSGVLQGLSSLPAAEAAALETVLRCLDAAVRGALGEELLGLYVTGSLVMGDFVSGASDVDFLAVTRHPFDASDVPRVARLHDDLVQQAPAARLLEGGYAAAERLRPWGIEGMLVSIAVGTAPSPRQSDYSADNMWALRHAALRLAGPPPWEVFPPVGPEVLQAGLFEYLDELVVRPADAPPPRLAANLLNIARCLFAMEVGRACTKREAAEWMAGEVPALGPGLRAALAIRGGAKDANIVSAAREAFHAACATAAARAATSKDAGEEG